MIDKNINIEDVVLLNDIRLSEVEKEMCKKIAANNVETWQKNRTQEDKLKDIYLGKIAEKALLQYFSNNGTVDLSNSVAFYDDFRVDEFKHHNSIDFIFSREDSGISLAKEYIQKKIK